MSLNSIPVISGQLNGDYGRLCAMEHCLWLEKFCLQSDLIQMLLDQEASA